jgi:hypothetical protein
VTTERHPSVPDSGGQPTNRCRKVIPATCALDRGPVEPINLMVSKHKGTIVLDPQVTGSCVMSLDEQGATTLGNLLAVWLW